METTLAVTLDTDFTEEHPKKLAIIPVRDDSI
jgi:hypothetical protein